MGGSIYLFLATTRDLIKRNKQNFERYVGKLWTNFSRICFHKKMKFSMKIKVSLNDYLTMTAATNIKHRMRMSRLYYYAEKNNFLVFLC